MLSRGYIDWLEKLPCNRAARRRRRPSGEWLGPWLPERQQSEHWEPFEAAMTEPDTPNGLLQRLTRLVGQITSGIWSPTLGQAIALT